VSDSAYSTYFANEDSHVKYLYYFLFSSYTDHRDLPSFPTRRSSDLHGSLILFRGFSLRSVVSNGWRRCRLRSLHPARRPSPPAPAPPRPRRRGLHASAGSGTRGCRAPFSPRGRRRWGLVLRSSSPAL